MRNKFYTSGTSENKQRNNKYYIHLLLIFFSCLIFTFFMSNFGGDDIVFLNRVNDFGYIKASIDYYNNWSSRTVIELLLMFFSKHHLMWQIFNSFVMTGTVYIVTEYTLNKKNIQNLYFVFGIYAMIPLTLMRETGWIATTLNYHWAVFFVLVAFFPFYQTLKDKEVTLKIYALSVISLIYGANQEQINICFFVLTLILTIYFLINKKYNFKLLILNIISFSELLYFLFSPGNKVRLSKEIIHWFPDYIHYSLINKFDLGLSSFGKPFFIDSNMLFFILFIIVAFLVYKSEHNMFLKFISAIPAFFNIIIYLGNTTKLGFSNYPANTSTAIFASNNLANRFSNTGTGLTIHNPSTWLPTILILFLIFCLTVGLLLSFKTIKKGLFTSLLFIMAVSSRIMIGFSPTVWASGVRTYLVTFIVTMIIISLLIDPLEKISKNTTDYIKFTITVIGISTFLLTILNN